MEDLLAAPPDIQDSIDFAAIVRFDGATEDAIFVKRPRKGAPVRLPLLNLQLDYQVIFISKTTAANLVYLMKKR